MLDLLVEVYQNSPLFLEITLYLLDLDVDLMVLAIYLLQLVPVDLSDIFHVVSNVDSPQLDGFSLLHPIVAVCLIDVFGVDLYPLSEAIQ